MDGSGWERDRWPRLYPPGSDEPTSPSVARRRGPGVSAYLVDGAIVHVLTWLSRPADADARLGDEPGTWVALRLA